MNKELVMICLVGMLGLFLVFGPMRINVGGVDSAKIDAAAEVFSEAIGNPEGGIPESVLEQAVAIVVVPGVFHGSILYERGYGDGIVIVRTEEGTWSKPSFIKFLDRSEAKGKVGSDNVILIFNDRKSIALFKSGRFVLGRDISATAGFVTGRAENKAEERAHAGVYFYGMADGRLRGIAIGQVELQVNDWANRSFYSSRDVTFDMLLAKEGPMAVPVAASRFVCIVARYGNAGRTC